MFCNQCGTANQDAARFCNGCGLGLTEQAVTDRKTLSSDDRLPKSKPEASNVGKRKVGRSFAILALIGIGCLVIWGIIKSAKEAAIDFRQPDVTAKSFAVTSQPTPAIPVPHTIPVAKSAFTVSANSYVWFEINVPRNAREPKIVGSFEATGGSGNDVQVLIVDEVGFTNFKNGHQFRSPYSTQRITTDRMNVGMRPGKFYLVFNNQFSILTPKAVTADVELYYETL